MTGTGSPINNTLDRDREDKPWVRHKVSKKTGEVETAQIPRFLKRDQPKGFVEADVKWRQRLEDENGLAPVPLTTKPEASQKPAPVRRRGSAFGPPVIAAAARSR